MLNYQVAIVAYNEENTLPACLATLEAACYEASRRYSLLQTFICVNGCTDRTEEIARSEARQRPELRIRVVASEKGMLNGQSRIVDLIENDDPIIFVDADTILDRLAVSSLLDMLASDSRLKIVGGFPTPVAPDPSLWSSLKIDLFNARGLHPFAEVAKSDCSEYHRYASDDYQNPEFLEWEKSSKIYFHGRYYGVKSRSIFERPVAGLGDDTFLTFHTYRAHGPGVIRMCYRAKCYYRPIDTWRDFWRTYTRIGLDKRTLASHYPGYADYLRKAQTRINWRYLRSLGSYWRLIVAGHFLLRGACEKVGGSRVFRWNPDRLWSYSKKKRLEGATAPVHSGRSGGDCSWPESPYSLRQNGAVRDG